MSSELFVIAEVMPGKLNALVKNMMQQMGVGDANEAVRGFNAGEWIVSKLVRSWREQDGVIYLSITSDGTTGLEWIKRLEKKGVHLSDYAKSVLRSSDFKPTKGVTTEVAVLKGELFADKNRITSKIRAEADKQKLTKPNAEVACLIREKLSDEDIEAMGFWCIVVMHEPIKDSAGDPLLLSADRDGDGRWLHARWDGPGGRWRRGCGFAFAVS